MTEAKTPVYFVIGESDEYYGSEPFKEAYQILYELYAEQGLAKSEIDNLLVLDIKEKNYFAGTIFVSDRIFFRNVCDGGRTWCEQAACPVF